MLRVVDIASHQEGISPAVLDCDIVIIKASGGASYVNPFWKRWADEALAAGKLVGLYHFACEYGTEPGGRAEAEYFWHEVKEYKGKFVPILDWEAHAVDMPVSYAKAFLDRIAELSGSTPIFYAYASNLNSTDYSSLTKYPLWMASYLNRYQYSGWVDDPANTWGTGDWPDMAMYQYTSTGRIPGWNGNLDLSVFYGTQADWKRMQGGSMGLGDVAAAIHRDMCDDEDNGYSWTPRWGEDGKPIKSISVDGYKYEYDRGSYDCASSTITAWRCALSYTKHAHMLDGATFTGNMKDVFLASGLFEWKPIGFAAQPGDLYLSIVNHVAMCQGGGMLSEFSDSENGDVYNNQTGDQTGWESHVCAYYNYPWDGILHYNGKADSEMASGGWVYDKDKDNWWYQYANGTYATGWTKISSVEHGDEWYYFDSKGWLKTGWIDYNGKRYYCQPKTKETGTHYGYMLTGKQTIGGKIYYFMPGDDGSMVRDCFRQSAATGKWYCYGHDGARVMDDKRITVNAKTGAVTIK